MKVCHNCGLYTEDMQEIYEWDFCRQCARAFDIGFSYGLKEGRERYEPKDPPWGNDNE